MNSGPSRGEKLLTGSWHLALAIFHFAAVPLLPTKLGKAATIIAGVWHCDAFWHDYQGKETLSKRGLRRVTGIYG